MPISPFSDLRNPYSVNQSYQDNLGNLVNTGTGYAVIVRVTDVLRMQWANGGVSTLPGSLAGIANSVWNSGGFLCTGQSTDASFTAFFNVEDFTNSDLNVIAANPQIWENGTRLTYQFETPAQTALNQMDNVIFQIIEVVDEATYNNGLGVPQGALITQATYGEIPVGTITATFGDPNCNGCSSIYNEMPITANQNLVEMSQPRFKLDNNGTMLNNAVQFPSIYMDGVTNQMDASLSTYSRGFYIGSYSSICGPSKGCRNPGAANFDTTTNEYWPNVVAGAAQWLELQKDCGGVNYVPGTGPYSTGGVGNESCCLFKIGGSGDGCLELSDDCGCLNTNASNWCSGCTEDCSAVNAGTDETCCTFYHEWKYCGGSQSNTWAAGDFINFTGNLINSGYVTLPNTPNNNLDFMEYYISQPGSPFATVADVPIGTTMRMRSMGSPGNYYCVEYMGPQPVTAVTTHGANAIHINSNSWWSFPVSLDASGVLDVPVDCETCVNPPTNTWEYKNCDSGEIINIINSWASDPEDEYNNNSWPNNPTFFNGMGVNVPSYNCTTCTNQWMVPGMVLKIDVPTTAGYSPCWELLGGGTIIGTSTGGWIEGIGSGTDNFIKVDADDITQVTNISDNCAECDNLVLTCDPICTDPTGLNYQAPPYLGSDCDCNGDPIGTNALGWNECCTACDNGCTDPLANNYDASASGCCTGVVCCTYNWKCESAVGAFNKQWPEPDSIVVRTKAISQWNTKYGITFTDSNPRPSSAWEHSNDSGYVWENLDYLNTSLRFLLRGGLGLNINNEPGGQGWGSGKQPSSYLSSPSEWNFATDFMNYIIGNGSSIDIDLSKSYYKVKTNMIPVIGGFKNAGSKVITEPIIGGTISTGLYYHIIPAGSLMVSKGFESSLPLTSGKRFNTWRTFTEELIKDGMPSEFSTASFEDLSNWVISYVERFPNVEKDNSKAAPQFVPESMQWMVSAAADCTCIEDPSGPYTSESQCENTLIVPGSGGGSSNCCACVYGCTDATAWNYDPTATCDDGSCLDCEPFILKQCSGSTYSNGLLCDTTNCGLCWQTPNTCANTAALLAGWQAQGLTNYGDVLHVEYIDSLNGGNCNMGVEPFSACYQWIDPNDLDYLTWLGSNTLYNYQVGQPLVLANPGLTITVSPYDNVSNSTTCQTCGDIPGCTDATAQNYDPNATLDDGSCTYCIYGCIDGDYGSGVGQYFSDINGQGPFAVYDCGTSTTIPTSASPCTSGSCFPGFTFSNFNPCATCDDGTCITPTYHDWALCGDATILSITAPGAPNDYASQEWFWQNVGTPIPGETINIISGDPAVNTCYTYIGTSATNTGTILTPLPAMVDWVYGQTHNADCATCLCVYGCTDPTMCNYDPLATCDNLTCCNDTGCLDPDAYNYCRTCCCAGPCDPVVIGCTDPDAHNYDPLANTACAHCCDYTIIGCTDSTAVNYNPLANTESVPSTCTYLNQCKRQPREFGSNPTKKLDVECSFASDVYKEYRKERYGLSNYCGSDLPDHLNQKVICDWEDSKRPAYLSSIITVLDKYSYPKVDNEINWFDPLRPIWTSFQCGLTSDVDIDMYFNYDTTSMGLAAIQNQRQAIEDWVNGMDIPFGGDIYHTLVFGERWVDWGTAVLTGVWNNSGSCGGLGTGCTPGNPVDHGNCPAASSASDAVTITTMNVTSKFWQAVGWGNSSNREFYAAMPSSVTNGSLNHLGFPPQLNKSQVLCVNFADESAAGTAVGLEAQPYHISPGPALYGITEWHQATDGTGTATNAATRAGSDSTITPCWKADYDFWIEEYNKHLARGSQYKATMVIYPCKPIGTLPTLNSQTAFPLHVLGGVDSGNKTVKDGTYMTGTKPQNDIVNLERIELGNPYWDTTNPVQPASHTFGYGGLDNYGWFANVLERAFDAVAFKEDLEGYWDPNRLVCDGSECIIVNVVNQNNVAVPDYDMYVDGGFVGKTDEFGRLIFSIPNAGVKTNHIINLCLCLITTGDCSQQNIKITVQEECAPECCAEPTGISCDTYIKPVQVFEGCTDPNASNYNPMASLNDGSCLYCDPLIVITETHVNVSATGAADGSITITITNGIIPLTYEWSNGSTTQNLTGLSGGVYTLTVTDSEGCDSTITININEDPDIYGCKKDDVGYWPNINGLNQAGASCAYPCSDDGTNSGTPEGYLYFCYNPLATIDGPCCEAGCTDDSMTNYCSSCTFDCNMDDINASGYTPTLGWDSCCNTCIYGCTNDAAGNYDASANCDDGSCEFWFHCIDATWAIDEVTNAGYTLSAINIFDDTTCQAGNCESSYFFSQLAVYYSTSPNDTLLPATELTMVNSVGASNSMGFLWFQNDCPASNMNSAYAEMPVGSIGGYTTENPYGPTAANSCYAAEQIADFGANYVFPTWAAYRDWHNNGINGSTGPQATCSGWQIHNIPAGAGTNIDTENAIHFSINTAQGGGGDMYAPTAQENWIYFTTFIPQCSGFTDCECVEDYDQVGEFPTAELCEAEVDTCCGNVVVEAVGGCIDNGYVGSHIDFGAQGATTEQEWWNGMNGAGQNYALANIPMLTCVLGITPINEIANGGAGTYGTGSTPNYPTGVPAYNYNPLATFDDGSCCYCKGCMDDTSTGGNYEVGACIDDNLCIPSVDGCTDPTATNYYPGANVDNGSCQFIGCMDAAASNYQTFENNGLTSYTWAGTTYGWSDIIQACGSCCNMPTLLWGCVTIEIGTPTFEDGFGITLVPPLDFASRFDLSTQYQVPNWGLGTGPQTMSDFDNYNTVWTISVLYAWSNATISDSYVSFDNFYFWYANEDSHSCNLTQPKMDSLYAQTGWTAPDGTSGFAIGNNAATNGTPNTYARPKMILAVDIHKWNAFGTTNLSIVSVGDVDTTFASFRDAAISADNLDGSGVGPNITGLDWLGVWDAFNSHGVGPDGFSYEISAAYGDSSCDSGEEKMCLQIVSGTETTCAKCSSDFNCGICI
jgi:hypothetical protein